MPSEELVSIISTLRVQNICLFSFVESSGMQIVTGMFEIAPKIPNTIPASPVAESISVWYFRAPDIVAFEIIS